jgi:hypothetical protein
MTTMAQIELRSGDQIVHFDGILLGKATSEYGYQGFHKPRWTEILIYRTTEEKYVIVKVGRSRIVHQSMDCKVLKNNEDPLRKVDLDDPDADYEFCDPNLPGYKQCWTDDSLNAASYGYLENDHSAVTAADNPQGAISACYSRDSMGVFSLSWLAKEALEEAFEHDSDLEDAYSHFDIGQLGRRTTR